jgi:general stress protein YciG
MATAVASAISMANDDLQKTRDMFVDNKHGTDTDAGDRPAPPPDPAASRNDATGAPAQPPPSKPRSTGFALMDPERRKAIASAGGKAAHARGTAHRFDSQAASEAGRRAHARGTAHVWTPEAAREAGRKGGRAPRRPRDATKAAAAAATTVDPSREPVRNDVVSPQSAPTSEPLPNALLTPRPIAIPPIPVEPERHSQTPTLP